MKRFVFILKANNEVFSRWIDNYLGKNLNHHQLERVDDKYHYSYSLYCPTYGVIKKNYSVQYSFSQTFIDKPEYQLNPIIPLSPMLECMVVTAEKLDDERSLITIELDVPFLFPPFIEQYFQKILESISQLWELLKWLEPPHELKIEGENIESISPASKDEIKRPIWEEIPDHLWDRIAIRMWCEGHTAPEIGKQCSITSRRVTNRISELRNKYPFIPRDEERRKFLIETHDSA